MIRRVFSAMRSGYLLISRGYTAEDWRHVRTVLHKSGPADAVTVRKRVEAYYGRRITEARVDAVLVDMERRGEVACLRSVVAAYVGERGPRYIYTLKGEA